MEMRVDLTKPHIEITILHGEEQLSFRANASVFTRKKFDTGGDVFKEINEYWGQQSPAVQGKIFDIYKCAHIAFDFIMESKELYKELNQIIRDLLTYHPLDVLERWLRFNPAILVPSSVGTTLPDATDTVRTVGKTYIVSDYYSLIAMIMFLRTIVPIWGEYISAIRKAADLDKKEFMAMKLVVNTGLLETQPMMRLMFYVNEMLSSPDSPDWDKVVNGFSSEDIPFLTLSLVCVRSLALVGLTGVEGRPHAVSQIFKFLAQRLINVPDGRVEIKEVKKMGENENSNNHSILESYRRRTEISLGDQASYAQYLSLTREIALRLEPTLTDEEIESSLRTAAQIESENIGDAQMIIAGWLLKDQITPYSPYYVKDTLPATMGALEAVLWKRGFKYMAAAITSYAIEGREEISVGNISSREQIDSRIIVELEKYYPYKWAPVKKHVVQPAEVCVLESINAIVDELVFNSWRMTLSEEKTIELFGERRRKLIIPSDIKTILAKLMIDIEARKY